MDGFEILSKIGEGAYSTVYKVRRNTDNEIYALKKVKMQSLSAKEKQNALNEVRILASVKSDYVISYKEAFVDQSDKTLCIVMEYADQGDLYQKITAFQKKKTSFQEIDVWRIFIQITKGLHDLHEYNILHRDMKSANVFLFSNGNAKLGDLNVSKVARRGLGHTQTGTPYYASPEVWKDNPYDLKSDIWSLGCVTYEMIMLKTPFRAETMEGLFQKIMKGDYTKLSKKYSEDLSYVIGRLLTVSSTFRPTTDQILNLSVVKKRIELFNIFGNQSFNTIIVDNNPIITDNKSILETIRIPMKLVVLNKKLPSPTYNQKKEEEIHKNKSFQMDILPKIKVKNLERDPNSIIITQTRQDRKSSILEEMPKTMKIKVLDKKSLDSHQLKMMLEEERKNFNMNTSKNLNKMKDIKNIYKAYTPLLNKPVHYSQSLKNNYSDASLFGNLNYSIRINSLNSSSINPISNHKNKGRIILNERSIEWHSKFIPVMKVHKNIC